MCGSEGVEAVVEQSEPDISEDEELTREIARVLNRRSRERLSNTPDFILATVMVDALVMFEGQTNARDEWYGHRHKIGGGI